MPVFSLWLQVMVFSKNQSEEEIDEMHSNYSKWLGHIGLYEAGFAPRGPGGPIQRFLLCFSQYVLSEWMNEWAFIVTYSEKQNWIVQSQFWFMWLFWVCNMNIPAAKLIAVRPDRDRSHTGPLGTWFRVLPVCLYSDNSCSYQCVHPCYWMCWRASQSVESQIPWLLFVWRQFTSFCWCMFACRLLRVWADCRYGCSIKK